MVAVFAGPLAIAEGAEVAPAWSRRYQLARALAWSPEGARLAIGFESAAPPKGRVAVRRGLAPEAEVAWSGPSPRALAYSPDGRLLAIGDADGALTVLDRGRPDPTASLTQGTDVLLVAFSPDGRWLLAGTEHGWLFAFEVDPAAGVLLDEPRRLDDPLRAAAAAARDAEPVLAIGFLEPDRLIALDGSGRACTWQLEGAPVRAGPGVLVSGELSAADVSGAWIALGLADGRVRVRPLAHYAPP